MTVPYLAAVGVHDDVDDLGLGDFDALLGSAVALGFESFRNAAVTVNG